MLTSQTYIFISHSTLLRLISIIRFRPSSKGCCGVLNICNVMSKLSLLKFCNLLIVIIVYSNPICYWNLNHESPFFVNPVENVSVENLSTWKLGIIRKFKGCRSHVLMVPGWLIVYNNAIYFEIWGRGHVACIVLCLKFTVECFLLFPACPVLSNMCNVGTYMPSHNSVGLQYMPMINHGTMTTHSQYMQQSPISEEFLQQQSEMQHLPEFHSMINETGHSSFAVPASSSSSTTRTSYENWSNLGMRSTQSTVCLATQPADFLNMQQPQQQQTVNGFINAPISCGYQCKIVFIEFKTFILLNLTWFWLVLAR